MFWLQKCTRGCSWSDWAKELLEGLMLVDPSNDWHTHKVQLKPIDNPRGVARVAKQKFAASYRELDSQTPLILNAHTASAASTDISCTMLMTVGC